MMKKAGYPAKFAAAVEAVSGTGDLIVPPIMGTAAFIMPEFLGIPYATVAIAALVPGILYYLGDFVQIDLRAAKIGLQPLPPEEIPSIKQVFKKDGIFWYPLVFWSIPYLSFSKARFICLGVYSWSFNCSRFIKAKGRY
jgi:TRAP-type uncharacterized transport system fused permease subunit